MEAIQYIVMLLLGIALGAVATWLILRGGIANAFQQGQGESRAEMAALSERLAGRETAIEELKNDLQSRDVELRTVQAKITELSEKGARLETALQEERRQGQEKLALLEDAKKNLSDAFKALAYDTLKSNSKEFLVLAETKFEPVKESLVKVDTKLQEIEKTRLEAYTGLTEQVKSMREAQDLLRGETSNLVQALRRPEVRGRWGEIQLQRVVEIAGMKEHCDFDVQQSVDAEEGRFRPDMIIHLAGNREIIVDAKTPLDAYLSAIEAPDEETRNNKLKDHARQIRNHIQMLGGKKYFEHFPNSLDFVVLFIPGEAFYTAALQQDPELIEIAADQHVFITSPTSLIAFLKAVDNGWQQEKLAENAQQIKKLGRELYDRVSKVAEHFGRLGKGLGAAIKAYNDAIGSLENRVLASARRFKELGAVSAAVEDIEELTPVETAVHQIQAPELLLPNDRPDETHHNM